MTGILGKKIGMTQVFTEDGKLVPVTVVEAGPCYVVQVKTPEKDGYEAVKVGFVEVKKEKSLTKPVLGVFRKAGTAPFRYVREFRMSGLAVGEAIRADLFTKGDTVTVSGVSKGKGFQGVMKKHRFKGGPDGHGSMFNRAPGSIGASSYPSRVWRGKKMAGRMGNERITLKNLKIVDVRPDQNLLLIRGAIPGAPHTLVEIRKEG
ncbi:MAG: 50S ribosomal protein L3 [Chloroflexota bacterium]|jgi:large subunit ribosomal protein L3